MTEHKRPSLVQLPLSVLCDDEIRPHLELDAPFFFCLIVFAVSHTVLGICTYSTKYSAKYCSHLCICFRCQSCLFFGHMSATKNPSNILSITLMPKKMCSMTSRYMSLIKTPIWPNTILLLPCTRLVGNRFWNYADQNNHFSHLVHTDQQTYLTFKNLCPKSTHSVLWMRLPIFEIKSEVSAAVKPRAKHSPAHGSHSRLLLF